MAVVSVVVLGVAPAASADHLDIDTSAPDSVRAGDTVELRVVVKSSEGGDRVPGATVIAYREAAIVGVSGRVELARAVSNDQGIATLVWQARGGTSESVIVAYATQEDLVLESQPLAVVTVGAGPQLVRSRAGVSIPGFGAWMLIALLVAIWGTIQFAMYGPVRIAGEATRHGGEATGDGEEAPNS